MSMNRPADYDPKHPEPKDWGPTRTVQSLANDTDINNIMKRFMKTGELTHISEALGAYRDISGIPDLHEALNIVTEAQSMFNELPGEVRALVGHDVGNFLPWIDDPDNLVEAIDHGLLPESLRPKPEVVVETPPQEVEGESTPPS